MWKLEEELNQEVKIEQVPDETAKGEVRGVQKGLAQVCDLLNIKIKISIRLTIIRYTSVSSSRHGKNNGK
jgi:hypothetical protein